MLLTIDRQAGMLRVTDDRNVPNRAPSHDDMPIGGPVNPGRLPRWPRDLGRSRQTGMSRTVCASCGAVRDQGRTYHTADCAAESGSPQLRRETTGPLTSRQTSRDVGWS